MARGNIDWVGIQASYRSGQLPNLEIARRYGVTEGAIRYRVKRENWQQDLNPDYKAGVRSAILRKPYESTPFARKIRSGPTEERKKDILAAAIEEGKEVVLRHQDLGKLLGENSRRLAVLISTKIKEIEASDSPDAGVLYSLARSHEAVTRATANTIQIERQSRGLDDQILDPAVPPSISITYYRADKVLHLTNNGKEPPHEISNV
jgi:hypothetical protein